MEFNTGAYAIWLFFSNIINISLVSLVVIFFFLLSDINHNKPIFVCLKQTVVFPRGRGYSEKN